MGGGGEGGGGGLWQGGGGDYNVQMFKMVFKVAFLLFKEYKCAMLF